jgi:hypothetical protein
LPLFTSWKMLGSRFCSFLLRACFVTSGPQLKQNLADVACLLQRWKCSELDLTPVAEVRKRRKGKVVAQEVVKVD